MKESDMVTGQITRNGLDVPAYGDTISFTATVQGKLAARSEIYVNVVCIQDGEVVYQASQPVGATGGLATFTLLDQAGDGLDWNGEAAHAIASLVYRIDHVKGSAIIYLDSDEFDVT